MNNSELRQDVAEALVQEGFTLRQARDTSLIAEGHDFASMLGDAMKRLGRPNAQAKAVEEKPMTLGAEARICKGYKKKCDEVLDPHNTSGLCKKCYARKFYAEHYGTAVRRGTKKPTRKAKPTNGVIDSTRYSIEVTEQQLDRYLRGFGLDLKGLLGSLPVDLKVSLANHFLAATTVTDAVEGKEESGEIS